MGDVPGVAVGGTDSGPVPGSLSNDFRSFSIADGFVVTRRLSLLFNSSEPGHDLLVAGLDTTATVGLLAVAFLARIPLLVFPPPGGAG